MKKTETQNLRSKTTEELLAAIAASEEKLWKLRKDVATGKLKNVREIRTVKKQIAAAKTILNEKNKETK